MIACSIRMFSEFDTATSFLKLFAVRREKVRSSVELEPGRDWPVDIEEGVPRPVGQERDPLLNAGVAHNNLKLHGIEMLL